NELDDKRIRIRYRDGIVETGVEKFGALIGDGVSIGANAVIAPGAILDPGLRIGRLQLLDQHPEAARLIQDPQTRRAP
ncbi:MAG: transferase, partial [Pseudomonadota bacterium]